ncbi:MAG TPA: hypothetical protein VL096_14820 [Pirellulaceae bacterium]|nr:hypothetical protein [Pirellulaceae bacterium]
MASVARGQLIISVDLELEVQPGLLARQRALDELTATLIDQFAAYRIPATFAVADPIHSAATDMIVASSRAHEIAVLADATWAGPGAGRERFARELARRFGSARAAGLNVSSLALRHLELAEHFDLLPKHGISAVRTEPMPRRHGPPAQPHVLRYGVWQAQASLRLPQPTRWWWGGDSAPALRLVKRAARHGEVAHLLIDGAELIANVAKSMTTLERVLAVAAQLRDAEQLQIQTLQEVVLLLARPRELVSQRSILRAA